MNKFLRNLYQSIFWGGLTREEYAQIKNAAAKKNIVFEMWFAVISIVVYGVLIIINQLGLVLTLNEPIYIVFFFVSLALCLLIYLFGDRANVFSSVFAYAFFTMLILAGMSMTLSDIEQKATMFLIFLSTMPLLFVLRPINVIVFEIIAEIAYIILLSTYQSEYEKVYSINVVNSITITILSLIIGTIVICEKTRSLYYANHNQYLLKTDVLTGLYNRRHYEEHLNEIGKGKPVLGVVSFDVCGLKHANDKLGHHAGDELISGAADCIKEVFSPYGYCFRTGGDEYIALLYSEFDAESIDKSFRAAMETWTGQWNKNMHISYGLIDVRQYPEATIEEILRHADSLMYKDKAEYYYLNPADGRD